MECRIPVTVNGNDVILETDRSFSYFVLTAPDFYKLKEIKGWKCLENGMGLCKEISFDTFLDFLPSISNTIGKKIEIYAGIQDMGTVSGTKDELPILEGERQCNTYEVVINREPYLRLTTYKYSIIECRQEIMNFIARLVGAYTLLK